jgi:cystathionine gamma-synthase
VGFPYVDVLKIQTESDAGVHFFPGVNEETQQAVEALVGREKVSGIICEFAGNPLLTSTNVPRLAATAQAHELPLIIDETLGTYANVHLLPHVDALVTSLTKYVAGAGDVMAGALILNRKSPFYGQLYAGLQREYENLLWEEDARALEAYSRDFPERMAVINANAEAVCAYLAEHPKVDRLYYPKYTTPEDFAAVKKAGGGYSGLFSVLLKDAARSAPLFYDRLRVSKGPSLGTNFTLACPYTLLAHYDELDVVEAYGVSRYLVRVSVGLENADDLIRRFQDALGGC